MAATENKLIHTITGAGASNGNWVNVEQYEVPYSLHFLGAGAGDTYQVYVSNAEAQPADATDAATLGAVVNADNTARAVTETYRWLKAKKTAGTQSSTVRLQAHLRR